LQNTTGGSYQDLQLSYISRFLSGIQLRFCMWPEETR